MSEVYLLLILFSFIRAHFEPNDRFCGFDADISITEMRHNGEEPPLPDANVPFTQFRIYYDYAHLDSQLNSSNTDYINSIKNLLAQAKDAFEKIITFQQRNNILALGSVTCPPMPTSLTISSIAKSPGVPADLIIIPYLEPSLNENAIAAASACAFRGYPYLGRILIQPKLPIHLPNANEMYSSVFMHEITHILAFNSGLFSAFRDPSGRYYENVTIKKVINGVSKTLLATPKVIEAAKRHFGCDSIEGVELEDYGGSGTAGSHWDGRVMLGDYMIGSIYEEMFISDITMALFEDSGWYKMNYYTGGQFKFGRGEGCSFLNQKCIVNRQSTNPKYYQPTKTQMCYQGRTVKGISFIANLTEAIPKEYQYFDNPKTGGHRMADFCPIAISDLSKEKVRDSNCKTGDLNFSEYGEIVSRTSNCLMSSLIANLTDLPITDKAICYPFRCDFFRNTTLITVMRNEVECPTEGGNKTFPGYKGSIQCPRFDEMCTTQTPCFGLFDCIERKSLTYYHNIKASFTSLNRAFLILIIALL